MVRSSPFKQPVPADLGKPAEEPHDRSVNQLLADLRRTNISSSSSGPQPDVTQIAAPSVPPAVREILQLPETPAPRPRGSQRLAPGGRRPPPGPAAPRSWLAQSRHAPARRRQEPPNITVRRGYHGLPGLFTPEKGRGTLVDAALRTMMADWEFHKDWNRFHLPFLPGHLRVAIISYVGQMHDAGVTLANLRSLLVAPSGGDDEGDKDDGDLYDDDDPAPSPSSMNEDIMHLNLAGSIGRSIKLKELKELLFPSEADTTSDLQDSWDTPGVGYVPRPLLPNLTHLSLAVDPQRPSNVSWRQLLSFSTHLPTLTHLSLAFWPEPSLTPNGKYASVISPQGRTVQYGGTSFYSHSIDNEWSEAIMVLRKLSKALYGLEYLDLTGCFKWFPALMKRAEHDEIDWVADWGKITHLRLYYGIEDLKNNLNLPVVALSRVTLPNPMNVEKHIRKQRAGQGRIITVERDDEMAFQSLIRNQDYRTLPPEVDLTIE